MVRFNKPEEVEEEEFVIYNSLLMDVKKKMLNENLNIKN
jgi:hypothetical protein